MKRRQIKEQIDLIDYEQFKQTQNHEQQELGSQRERSQNSGPLLFQLDSPKFNIEQAHPKYDKPNEKIIEYNQVIQNQDDAGNGKFTYEIQLGSEHSEQEKQGNKTPFEERNRYNLHQPSQQMKEANAEKSKEKAQSDTHDEHRDERINRGKHKNGLKDNFDGPQSNLNNRSIAQEGQKANEPKNIEYAKIQSHTQFYHLSHEGKQMKQLPPLQKQRTKKQPEDPSFVYNNDSSIMDLHKFGQYKQKDHNSAQNSHLLTIFNQFAFKPAPYGRDLVCSFRREKICMQNYYHPEFSLVIHHNRLVFSARKEWGHLNSHYNISCQQKNYLRQGNYYAGYLKGNFAGSRFNLFSCHDETPDLVATILYKTQFSCIQPASRKIQVYVKNEDYVYHELAGCIQGQDIGLDELYGVQDNATAKKIIKLVNKQALWNPILNAYTMSFNGKSKLASVKNSILVEEGEPQKNIMMLCKQQLNDFYLQIGSPLSPFMAMGITLSSFDFKLCSQ